MLRVSYDPLFVTASVPVAFMASFTGPRLASGLGQLKPARRKPEIAKAAIALGGGIRSMHFAGMLAVRTPAQIEYDALATLGSVLAAILITGIGLIVRHLGDRTPARIVVAGILMGLGIVSMHYPGMSAIGGNRVAAYEPAGYFLSTLISIGSSICALWLACQKRTLAQIATGSFMLGIAIPAMHRRAMIYTRFSLAVEVVLIGEPVLSTGNLALLVSLSAFIIRGLFLLTAIPVERNATARPSGARGSALRRGSPGNERRRDAGLAHGARPAHAAFLQDRRTARPAQDHPREPRSRGRADRTGAPAAAPGSQAA